MTLFLIRMASLAGPPLLGGGFVVTAMLLPGLMISSFDPPPSVAASPFESAAGDASDVWEAPPPLFNRGESGRSAIFITLLTLQADPPTESIAKSALRQAGIQTPATRLGPATIQTSIDGGDTPRVKSLFNARFQRTSIGLFQGESTSVNRTTSASSSEAPVGIASQSSQPGRTSLIGQTNSNSNVVTKPGSGTINVALGLASPANSNSTTSGTSASPVAPYLQPYQTPDTIQAVSAGSDRSAGSGRSAATPSR